jgi:lipopolysaccharide exporter
MKINMKFNELFHFLLKPGARLSQRIITASFWAMTTRVSARGLSFIRIIILARILTPEAFGLVGVGLLGIDLVMTLTNTGFNTALIQKKGNIKDYLDTAWIMAILRGLVMGGVLFFCAPLIAQFFGSPEARPIVQVMASLVFIDGFTNPGIIYLVKELEIQKQFIYNMSQALTDLAVTIPAAIILRSPWAIVYGAIAGNIVGLIVSFFIHPYRPRFRFDLQKAKTLFNFGKWLTVSSWVNYAKGRGDIIFVGRLLGVGGLGLYQIARRISDTYSLDIVTSTFNVVFPAYSKIQDNIPKLREAFLLSMETMASVVFPLGVAIYMLAPSFTPIIFGPQWIEAVPAMKIIAIAAGFSCVISVGQSLFYSLGRPSLVFYMTAISTVVMLGLFYPLYQLFGLSGAAIAVLVGNISPFPILIYTSMKSLEIKPRQFLLIIIAPLVISLAIMVTSFLAVKYVNIQSGLAQLIVIFIIVALFTLGITILLWRKFTLGPLQIIDFARRKH